MPHTPLHIGPSTWIGILFFRYINFFSFVVSSVLIDLTYNWKAKLNLQYPTRIFLHTYLGGVIVAFIFSIIIMPFMSIINGVLKIFKLDQEISFKSVLAGALLGVIIHITLDAFIYDYLTPFFPLEGNPFYGWFTKVQIEDFCKGSFIVGGIFYVLRLITVKGERKTEEL